MCDPTLEYIDPFTDVCQPCRHICDVRYGTKGDCLQLCPNYHGEVPASVSTMAALQVASDDMMSRMVRHPIVIVFAGALLFSVLICVVIIMVVVCVRKRNKARKKTADIPMYCMQRPYLPAMRDVTKTVIPRESQDRTVQGKTPDDVASCVPQPVSQSLFQSLDQSQTDAGEERDEDVHKGLLVSEYKAGDEFESETIHSEAMPCSYRTVSESTQTSDDSPNGSYNFQSDAVTTVRDSGICE